MKKIKKISLNLNKEVIDQLDKNQLKNIVGGDDYFTTIWGSNCNNTDPHRHKCCEGHDHTLYSYNTVTCTTPGTCCGCGNDSGGAGSAYSC